MERDFLGLNSKESVVSVKEDVKNDGRDSEFNKGSGIHGSFSNKVSTLPRLMSFKNVNQEDKSRNIVSAFMPFSTAECFAPKRASTGENQSAVNLNQQGGLQVSLTTYPMQQDMPAHHNNDVKKFPFSDQTISKGSPFFKNFFASAGEDLADATTKQHLFRVPVTAPQSFLPTLGSVAGIGESSSKTSGVPVQLTIFYAGEVNVFDNVSPEKLQAIMSLADNVSTAASNSIDPKEQVEEPSSKQTAGVGVPVNHSNPTQPCSSHSSPLSVTSRTGLQSMSGSTNSDELLVAKNTEVATNNHISQVDSTKVLNAMRSVATTMIPSAVPQARKASLARFLEKRKERVTSASPNNFKKSIDCNCINSSHVSSHVLGSSYGP